MRRAAFPYGLVLGIEDLEPHLHVSLETLLADVRAFEAPELAQVLGRVNVLLADQHMRFRSKEEMALVSRLFPKRDVKRVALWVETGVRQKIIHRDSLRALLQLVIAEDSDEGSSLSENPDRIRDVGWLLLKMNLVSAQDYLETSKSLPADSAVKRKLVLGDVYRTFFLQHTDQFGPSIARYWALYGEGMQAVASNPKLQRQSFDLADAFEKAVGCSYAVMMAVGFAIWSYYEALRTSPLGEDRGFGLGLDYLSKIEGDEVRKGMGKVLEYLSWDWKTHVAEIRAWRAKHPRISAYAPTLYRHPLVTVPDRGHFLLDMDYLVSRLTEGVYWAIFDSLPNSEKQRLAIAFGRAVEWYVANILRATFRAEPDRSLWLDWDDDIKAEEGCSLPDAIVIEGTTTFLIEVTTVANSPTVSTSGDWDQVERGLKAFWFGAEGKARGKLLQLHDAVESFKKGKVSGDALDVRRSTNVVPVLVSLRTLPQMPVLTPRYRELMIESNLPAWFIDDLIFLDLSELEWMATLRLMGRSWTNLLIEKKASPQASDSVRNFLYKSPHPWDWHPSVKSFLDEAFDALSLLLFGHPMPKSD